MKICLAARYSRMEELKGYADELAAAGHVNHVQVDPRRQRHSGDGGRGYGVATVCA